MANKEFVKLLKGAKKHLAVTNNEFNKTSFICFAINRANSHGGGNRLRDIIHERLGTSGTIEQWLLKNKHITRHQLLSKKTKNKIQQFRHAWVDELIREFS